MARLLRATDFHKGDTIYVAIAPRTTYCGGCGQPIIDSYAMVVPNIAIYIVACAIPYTEPRNGSRFEVRCYTSEGTAVLDSERVAFFDNRVEALTFLKEEVVRTARWINDAIEDSKAALKAWNLKALTTCDALKHRDPETEKR